MVFVPRQVDQQKRKVAHIVDHRLQSPIIPKIAYDTDRDGKHFHAEIAGLLSGFKIADLPTLSGAAFTTHTKEGGGVEAAFNFEVVKNFRVLANAFWSDGGGRYIFGMAPDLVIAPTNASGMTCTIVGTAASYGVDAHEAHSSDEVFELVKAGIADRDRPTLINARTTPVPGGFGS